MSKPKLATVWLDGCSGCHMSFLDTDERLLTLTELADIVYSPLVDTKVFPSDVDITLVEGAVSSVEDEEKIKHIRANTRYLVALGDCAVTANVPSMRNTIPVHKLLDTIYKNDTLLNPQIPTVVVPPLLAHARPVRAVVKVDVFVPGCPPSADTIYYTVSELLAGRVPDLSDLTRFGA